MSTTQNAWERKPDTTSLTSKEPVKNRKPVWEREKSVARDIGNVAPSALRTGVELAVPPVGAAETSGLIPRLAQWIASFSPLYDEQTEKDFQSSYNEVMHPTGGIGGGEISMDPRDSFGLQTFQENVTNPLFGEMERKQAETLPGKMVQRTLETAPSVFMGPGGLGQKAVVSIGSGVGGPGAAALAEEAGLSPAWQSAADIGGTLAGGVSPMVWNRLVNPYPTPPVRQPSVDILRSRNVPMSVGQTSGNERLLRRELTAGGPQAWDDQGPAFTRAAAEEQGGFPPGTDTLTNRVMRTEFDRMGAEFNRLEQAAPPTLLNNQAVADLGDVVTNYTQTTPHTAPIVQTIVDEIQANALNNGGFIDGTGYQSIRSQIGKIVRASDDPHIQSALMEVQDILDNMMSIGLSPADQAAFRTVRAQYRNMLPIEYAKSQQGQQKRLGAIDPQSLVSGIRNIEGRREVAAGNRPMTELAEAGGGILTRPSTSGTAENLRAQLAGLLPLALGGGAGALTQMLPGLNNAGPLSILAGTLAAGAGAIAPKLRDAYTRSPFGQSIIGRNLAPRIEIDRAMLSALLAEGAAQAAEGRR